MNNVKGEVGKAILISLFTIWLSVLAAHLIIRSQFDAHVSEAGKDFGVAAPTSIFTLAPGDAIIYGVLLTVLVVIHWWISGLFGRKGMARMPIANVMLIVPGLCAALELFERGAQDFYKYSLFCQSGEPISVVLIDDVYLCERSRLVRGAVGVMVLLLPILAIPVRLIETRLRVPKA